jgi:hypothetical protein
MRLTKLFVHRVGDLAVLGGGEAKIVTIILESQATDEPRRPFRQGGHERP